MSVLQHNRRSFVAALADRLYERDFAEQRYMEFFRQTFAAAVTEDIILVVRQFGGCEIRHILDESEYGDIDFVVGEHIHAFACIDECNVLWRGHHDSAGELERLDECKMDIRGARRQVDEEIVEFSPVCICNQLLLG